VDVYFKKRTQERRLAVARKKYAASEWLKMEQRERLTWRYALERLIGEGRT
jgi:hypothetical protein